GAAVLGKADRRVSAERVSGRRPQASCGSENSGTSEASIMITPHRIAVAVLLTMSLALTTGAVATAQDTNVPLRTSVVCAPGVDSSAFDDAPRIVGSQDVRDRFLFGTRDLLVVDGGTNKGLHLGQ